MPVLVFIPLSLVCAGLILYRYYHAGRLAAGGGWAAAILAIGGFGSGLAGSFAWSGLVFLALGGLGLIVVVQDAAIRRRARRNRQSQKPDSRQSA